MFIVDKIPVPVYLFSKLSSYRDLPVIPATYLRFCQFCDTGIHLLHQQVSFFLKGFIATHNFNRSEWTLSKYAVNVPPFAEHNPRKSPWEASLHELCPLQLFLNSL